MTQGCSIVARATLSVLLAGAGLGMVGCGAKHEPPPALGDTLAPTVVRVQKIETIGQRGAEEIVGTVQPKLQAVIEAKVNGRITRLPVTVGQSVRQGDLLVELSTQEVQARLDQASAASRQAELDFKRISNLRQQGAATQSEFDTAQTRLTMAKAAVAEAEVLSGYAKVLAPFDGIIARKLADEGDQAMPGKPLLELEGRTGLRLVADVPSQIARHVALNAKLAVHLDTVPDRLVGAVVEVAPGTDPASRTVRVKVALPESAGARAGQFGRLAVPVGEAQVLIVPPAAVVPRGQLELLFVANGGQAQMRLARTGKRSPQGIEILAGLVAGESVVVQGADTLRDGQPLTTH